MGGFECSTHINSDRVRLDMIAATNHYEFALTDYQRLSERGIKTARDGIRWHLIEKTAGVYDFSTALPMIEAARQSGIQVIWDLCHYGWPDDIDIFTPAFITRFAAFAKAFVKLLKNESDDVAYITPINEISYFSWAAAEIGYIHPFCHERGYELKRQLVKATIETTEAIWGEDPKARIINVDPAIYITHDESRPEDEFKAKAYNAYQFQSRDMLIGDLEPSLGGDKKYLDILGINYYPFSQWIYGSNVTTLDFKVKDSYPVYKPLHQMLAEVYSRYGRPLFISETGTEGDNRADWLKYIVNEVKKAQSQHIPIEGVCWYPIVNNPHWDTGRHCLNGLWDYADINGHREIHSSLAREFGLNLGEF
jgi:beta-glucosidase/6-phospho-beta-glucosidase/beta-galactosidase